MGTVLFDRRVQIIKDTVGNQISDYAFAGELYSESINLETCEQLCFVTKSEPQDLPTVDFTNTDIVGDKIFMFPHPYVRSTKVRFTTTGVLPTGLALSTDYWLTNVNGFGFEVANSLENSINGVNIAFSGGSGVHTVNPQAFSTLNITLQASLDEQIWANVTNSLLQTSTNEAVMYEISNPVYKHIRLKYFLSSGQSILTTKCLMKGHGY